MTIASDRGVAGSPRARIRVPADAQPVFAVRNPGVRFTGLRVEGPTTDHWPWKGYGGSRISTGVAVDASHMEIDNCLFRGFTHAGVVVAGVEVESSGSTSTTATSWTIRNGA